MKSKKKIKKYDKKLHKRYDKLYDEILGMQKYLKKIDKKAKKKAEKLSGGDKKKYKKIYKEDKKRAYERYKLVEDHGGLFDHILYTLDNLEPTAKFLSRLVATLVVTILSVEGVRMNISPNQLDTLDRIYKLSMKV